MCIKKPCSSILFQWNTIYSERSKNFVTENSNSSMLHPGFSIFNFRDKSLRFPSSAAAKLAVPSLRISIGSERIDGPPLCIIHGPNWCLFKFDVLYLTRIEILFKLLYLTCKYWSLLKVGRFVFGLDRTSGFINNVKFGAINVSIRVPTLFIKHASI